MRLFVAISPSAEAVADLAAAVADVRRDVSERRLRWSEPARWHLTLAFLGEVPERRAEDLRVRLGRVAHRHPAPSLRFAGAGRFGDRVLWVGVDGEVEPLRRLAASSGAAGRHCGIDVEDRAYRPHLTVARGTAAGRDGDLGALVEALADYGGSYWRADRLRLVRSHLGPQPRHEELAAWPLQG